MGTYIGPPCSTPVWEGVLFPHSRHLSCYRRVTSKGYPTLGTCTILQYHFYNATCSHRCIHESLLVLYQLCNYYGRYRRFYFRAVTCRGTYSIGAEPGGCDGACIKLHYGKKLRGAGISGRKRPEASGVPTPVKYRCQHRCVTFARLS